MINLEEDLKDKNCGVKLLEANAHIFCLHGRLKFQGENYRSGEGKLSPANFPSILVILSKHDALDKLNATESK
jgi:hypothetical protein